MMLLQKLLKDFPQFTFQDGPTFLWSPRNQTVRYRNADLNQPVAQWTLLHELSHGLLGHQQYQSDIELVKMEAEAWQKATELAITYGIAISEDYIQNCIDTYRDWLHLRSKCPQCTVHATQTDPQTYRCYNCLHTWHVSSSRFCRPYRRSHNKKTSPSQAAKAMFMEISDN